MPKSMMMRAVWCFLGLSVLAPLPVAALDVQLTADKAYIEVIHESRLIRVQRKQDQDNALTGGWAKTSRKCPPFCIQPMSPAPGVDAIGQIELFDFMENKLRSGEGILIDARTPAWFKRGTIPGSVNIPFKVFGYEPNSAELVAVLNKLGVNPRGEVGGVTRTLEEWGLLSSDEKNEFWDFTNAKPIVLWCNGPWCGQSPIAIRNLVALGYPPEKIFYYRGGMQIWKILGLTTIVPRTN